MSLQCCNPFAAVNATVLKFKDGSTPREFFFFYLQALSSVFCYCADNLSGCFHEP